MKDRYIPHALEAMHGALLKAFNAFKGYPDGIVFTTATFSDLIVGVKVKLLKQYPGDTPTEFGEWVLTNRIVKGSNAKSKEYYWPSKNEFLTIDKLYEQWVESLKS